MLYFQCSPNHWSLDHMTTFLTLSVNVCVGLCMCVCMYRERSAWMSQLSRPSHALYKLFMPVFPARNSQLPTSDSVIVLRMCMMPHAASSAMHGQGARHRCQALLMSVQNNGFEKSDPKYLACEESLLQLLNFSVALLPSTVG